MRGERRKVVGNVTTPGLPELGLLMSRAPILPRPSDNSWLTNQLPAPPQSSVPPQVFSPPSGVSAPGEIWTPSLPPSHYLPSLHYLTIHPSLPSLPSSSLTTEPAKPLKYISIERVWLWWLPPPSQHLKMYQYFQKIVICTITFLST